MSTGSSNGCSAVPREHRRRRVRSLAAALVVLLSTVPARAGVLLEGRLEGRPLRIELADDGARALGEVGGRRYLLELGPGRVFRLEPGDARRPVALPEDDGATLDGYRLESWSAGPSVAGYGSIYNVLQRGERICAEVLSSRWMKRFAEPLVRAIALLQRVETALRPRSRGACGRAAFATYARNGWPLMVGYRDRPIFVTERLRFGHPVRVPGSFGGHGTTSP